MKRMAMLLLALLMTVSCARAESRTWTMGNDEGVITAECVAFEGEIPADVRALFEKRLLEDDVMLCGARADLYSVGSGERWGSQALLAVQREGKVLLMGGRLKEDGWHICIETDDFLTPDVPFSIGAEGEFNSIMGLTNAWLTMYVEGGMYYLNPITEGIEVEYYVRRDPDSGDELVIAVNPNRGLQCEMQYGSGERDILYVGSGAVPARLGAWTHETFPKNETGAEYYHMTHGFVLKEDEAFITGVNLREKPTGESYSWGMYTARVKVLGSEPGLMAPWYNVQVGSLTGWVSGTYLVKDPKDTRYLSVATEALPVAKAEGRIGLHDQTGSGRSKTLPDGTLMHVLQEKDGWLHVIVPRYGFEWQVDWYGTYGYVRSSDVRVGVSPADVLYP